MNEPSINRRGSVHQGAFTLIELLVVVSIIALLMSILIPSMRKARSHAKEVACGSLLRGFGNGLTNYFYENNDWIPGMNTSGIGLYAKKMVASSEPERFRSRRLPVQPHDWLSMIIDEPNLADDRALRFEFLLKHFKCPELASVNTTVYDGVNAPDAEDFEKIPRWQATSYLMPAHFQYWGQSDKRTELASMEKFEMLPVLAKAASEDWEVKVENYRSKLGRIGNPGRKIFVADGTRFLDEDGILDLDYSLIPGTFGAFTSSGAWWRGSTAYGVNSESPGWGERAGTEEGSPSEGGNLRLSYRHSSYDRFDGAAQNNFGMMNALFFDGHVDLMNDQNSRKISHWYPKGAIVQEATEGMTEVEVGQVIQ